MKKKYLEKNDEDTLVDISPLLDVVFILLIFFVVTSTFTKDTGVDVKKPKAESASEIKSKVVQVAITKEGTIYFNQKQIGLNVLEDVLKREKNRSPDIKAIIVADDSSVTGILVKVIDKCNLAGIKDVSLAASKE